ncbi:tumor necrosis factor receptor superfamily member 1B [Rhineura floridana]|uniref:tumor necrosis factor receptor superfamily member 1B n=1 Tax=Rhineura floridana TaxID=261503 RepID=UPI002AC835D2|nr:tumor necrosis factor receptor superfamily member 1B [Rhineura floridana]
MATRGGSAGRLLCGALQLAGLLQVSSLLYTPQHPPQCHNPNSELYYETINKCCTLCPPGFRVLQSCSETTDTKCEECDEGMYTHAWSKAERCFSCSPPCKKGFVEVRECKKMQDRLCWCPPHRFCSLLHSGICFRCQPYQQCQRGQGVAKPGTKNSDVQCVPCGPGTFSDVESHSATCRPHRICKSEISPGNSTNDAICNDLGMPVDILTVAESTTVTGRSRLVTRSPTRNSQQLQQDHPADISSVAGWVAGVMFAVFTLIGVICFAFRKKDQHCAPPCGKEKQLFLSSEKVPNNWPQDTGALGQEKQNLLQSSISSSGSFDSPPESDKSSGISSVGTLKIDTERTQERSSPSNSCVVHSGANSKQSSSGGTHVNVSCTVSVCHPLDHSLPFQSQKGSATADSGDCPSPENLPLSKEESPLHRENGGQIAVEVEDNMVVFDQNEGKTLPLGVQDVGMKAT